ncbi:hypothetical protein N5A93_03920 [Roseovarius sp. EGI FJ00037]|nr:hypothetical protein [Roseovarius sp. EGI FJ00037]MCZ0811370.1 hypothetical protein [Roseovarius sp. EGI FJ00037]
MAVESQVSSFDDLSDETLQALSVAYQRLLRPHEARICHRILSERVPKNATFQNYATAQFRCGDAAGAIETQDRVNRDILTPSGLRIYVQERFEYMRALGQLEEAFDMLQAYADARGELSLGVHLKLAEGERQLGYPERAYRRLTGGLEAYAENPSYLMAMASCAGEINRNSDALLLSSLVCSRPKPQAAHLLVYLRLLWQEGATDRIWPVLKKVQSLAMRDPALLKFIREIAYVSPDAARFCIAFEDTLEKAALKAAPPDLLRLSEGFLSLDRFERARDVAESYIQFFKGMPQAYYVRGMAAFYLDDYELAEADLLHCADLNPGHLQVYGILLNTLPRHPDGVARLAACLERRDNSHSRFRSHAGDGRRGFLDIERSQLCFMQGDYLGGQMVRQERPVCRFLEQRFPATYTAFRDPRFNQSGGGSVLVISEDGVGDEVRWSQYYNSLLEHYDRVEITCDPRLETLLQRSFPQIRFHPFSRRLMERPGSEDSTSRSVPFFALARLIDDHLYARLAEFSDIRLTADMVMGAWAGQPGGQPLPEGPPDVAHMVPEPGLVKHWRAHFASTLGRDLKVGLVWRSSMVTPRRAKHYINPETMRPLLRMKGVQFVSLHAEHSDQERDFCYRHGIDILEDVDLQDDLETVAAVTASLDLVIGAGTFNAEMAAAVGTPVWLLGSYCNLVHFRLGQSEGDIDRLSPNMRIVRLDGEAGFTGTDAEMQRRVVEVARQDLQESQKSRLRPMSKETPNERRA